MLTPLLISTVGRWPEDSLAAYLTIATTVIAAARYSWILGSRDRHLYEMVLWLFAYFFFGLAPLVQMQIEWPPTTPNIQQTLIAQAAGVALVSVSAASFGSFLARKPRAASGVGLTAAPLVHSSRVTLLALSSLALSALYVVQVGPSSILTPRVDLALAQDSSFGDNPVGALVRAGSVFGLLVSFVALRIVKANRRTAHEPYPRVLTIVVLVTLIVLANPINSSRYLSGTVMLAIAAGFGLYSSLRRFRIVATVSITGLLLFFPLLDTFRTSLTADARIITPVDALLSGDFDAFAQIVNAIEYVSTMGITWGNQALGVLMFWVPRSIWESKPQDTGIVLAEFKNYLFTNLSAPFPAELLLNFGWPAVVIGMVSLGFILRRMDQHAELQLKAMPVPPVLGCILPFYLLILLRGSLLQATANLAAILLFSWFVSPQAHSKPGFSSASAASHARKLTRTTD